MAIYPDSTSVMYIMIPVSLACGYVNCQLAVATLKDPRTGFPATGGLLLFQLGIFLLPVIRALTDRTDFPEWYRVAFISLVVLDTFLPFLAVPVWWFTRLFFMKNRQQNAQTR
jgi:hypothetical protein